MRSVWIWVVSATLLGCAASPAGFALRRVHVHQSGLATLELRGRLGAGGVLVPGADADSLVVLEASSSRAVPSTLTAEEGGLVLRVEGEHDLRARYHRDVPPWRLVYRLDLPDRAGDPGHLTASALIENASGTDWRDVELVLETSAAFSLPNGLTVTPAGVPGALEAWRPSVTIECGEVVSLDPIPFERGVAFFARRASATAGVAEALIQTPEILLVRVIGQAASDEPDPDELARGRAEAVEAALIAAGVRPERLVVEARVAPPVTGPPESLAEARSVRFEILRVEDGPPEPAPPPPPIATMGWAPHGTTVTFDRPVTLAAGALAILPLASVEVDVAQLLAHGVVDGWSRHPWLAVRLRWPADLALAPGILRVYRGGAYLGDAALDGRSSEAVVPFAMDDGVRVERRSDRREESGRIVAMEGEAFTVEDELVSVATYVVQSAARADAVLEIHHRRGAGLEVGRVPDGAMVGASAVVVAVPLDGAPHEVAIEEVGVRRRVLHLFDHTVPPIATYLEGSALDDAERTTIRRILEQRSELGMVDTALGEMRVQLAEARLRVEELRDRLDAAPTATLRRAVEARLTEARAEVARLSDRVGEHRERAAALRAALGAELASIRVGSAVP